MKDKILATAVKIAETEGFRNVTRDAVANRMEVAAGSVSYHFKTMKNLQREVVKAAIESENLAIIAQALLEKHPLTAILADELKRRALMTIIAQ
jgi:AcrR family transcriptional regulator